VTVLDAYAVIAYLRGETAAGEVATLLRSPASLSAINVAEVMDQLARVFSGDPDDIDSDVALLPHAGTTIMPVTPAVALDAGRLRARH
jgi:PIN domain nuclease of toxin-antitoxin system